MGLPFTPRKTKPSLTLPAVTRRLGPGDQVVPRRRRAVGNTSLR